MTLTPNEYLDAREHAWLDEELLGRVKYDPLQKLVTVAPSATPIIEQFANRRPAYGQ